VVLGLARRVDFLRRCVLETEHVARNLHERRLEAVAHAEIRDLVLARDARRRDLALERALPEAAGHEDAVHHVQMEDRRLGFEALDAPDQGLLVLHEQGGEDVHV
jgi:16S rRNA G527 N7-methylase RsmG